ncbi:penicillin acylase family protein [Nocardioides sp. R-C-SC26]|uniref:penicillin acylase family protein n=1 Tax=Nocardioides sp. R-C-SC26 TaxID=2870414 RepID=UPI001E3D7BE0|nr:penicillin acylase family protein [Nocardioides sp. R-C-SC26]
MTVASSDADISDAGSPAPRRWPPLWWRRFQLLPRPLRVTTWIVVALALAMVAALLAGVMITRRSFPQTEGRVVVPGLGAEVDVVRDEHGIPQIYADTADDLFRAQGFVHAQERFFEMDVRRHATAGRLAEMFGEDAVETDVVVRTLGWRRVAERELPLLRPETRAALDAYAAGVNAYLEGRSLGEISLEYAVLDAGGLDHRPEPWTPVDSLAWLKAMAWDLRGNMDDEIARSLAVDAVGPRRAQQLFPQYPYADHDPIVTQGSVVDGVYEQDATAGGSREPLRPAPRYRQARERAALARAASAADRLPAWLGSGDGVGSNAWVVSGDLTDTGAPLLANDPHLGVGMPGVWMQVGLHCRERTSACPYDVAGFSFSGVPGVIIGHNADIAWGFTNLGPDVTDLYVEQVRGGSYRYDGQELPLRTRTERIKVRDGDDVAIEVRSTRHGPLLSDAGGDLGDRLREIGASASESAGASGTQGDPEYAVALAWTALQPSTTADAILALDRASDWDSFRTALSSFAAPGQNVVYADKDGQIGYQATGLIPIRKSGNDGRSPARGWRSEDDWTGEVVPYDALPHVLDPDEDFVVTANQAAVGTDYPYFLTDDWDRGYRSQRIRTLLEAAVGRGEQLDVEAMAAIQRDDLHPLAAVLVPVLLDVRLRGHYASDGQRLLADWDFTQPADGEGSAAAAYFSVVWRNLLALTFHDDLPEAAWPDGGQRWMAVVTDLLRRPTDPFWDDVETDERETRDDIIRAALVQARDELTVRQALDPGEWTWGELHELDLRSSTLGESGIAVVERLFNRGGWGAAGSGSAVAAFAWDAAEGYEVVTGPSMRMVVDLDDFDSSRWVSLTGVSGHAFHPHYTDQTDVLMRGDDLAWPFSQDAVDAAADDTLTLVPAPTTGG